MGSNKKKAETLGIAHGTASGRLRKMVLFRLVQKCGEDVCFRCGKKIEVVSDLSIEHKKSWEGVSAELFWDLENVTFSHRKCNRPDRRTGKRPKKAPLGTSWCTYCKKFQPVEEFYSNGSTWNGLQKYCKQARPPRLKSLARSSTG